LKNCGSVIGLNEAVSLTNVNSVDLGAPKRSLAMIDLVPEGD